MSTTPTTSQRLIIDGALRPQVVIACAGSGKTLTAVHRIAAIRDQLGDSRKRIALLSFSNVAVDTFRRNYRDLGSAGHLDRRVEITTLDSFFTTLVLLPHGHKTLGCGRRPFLATKDDPFLQRFNLPCGKIPKSVAELEVDVTTSPSSFYFDVFGRKVPVDRELAIDALTKMGKLGAYTHNLARYWVMKILQDQPGIRRALSGRYLHILVDEAQDLGAVHQAILTMLIEDGVQVSLIGDPNQAIYEFTGADGAFLKSYHSAPNVESFALTENFRSIAPILSVANSLTNRTDQPRRNPLSARGGAFIVTYSPNGKESVMAAFCAEIAAAGLKLSDSAVLCRATALSQELKGAAASEGVGVVKLLVKATIERDRHRDLGRAFNCLVRAVVLLLKKAPADLGLSLLAGKPAESLIPLRRLLWSFVSDPDKGLPRASLNAKSQWQPVMLIRTRQLLSSIQADYGFTPHDNLSRKLTTKQLLPEALYSPSTETSPLRIRIATVHQAKGESLDAVLYFTTDDHAKAMLEGTGSEVGRIGYVAATRARELLWVGIPAKSASKLGPRFVAHGFQAISSPSVEKA